MNAFSQYALVSLIEYNGLSPEEALIEVQPREGEDAIRTEDVLRVIEQEGESIAVVCMAGVQYYTGKTTLILMKMILAMKIVITMRIEDDKKI